MKHLLTVCTIVISCLTATAQQTILDTIMHNGVARTYRLYIPANYTGNKAVPLVFNFHGFTSTASAQQNTANFGPIADTAGFIVVSPQGTDLTVPPFNGMSHWNVGGWTKGSTADDIGFTEAMIDTISAGYNINSKRIYSTGFSNGGFFSFELACQLSNKIAAIASNAGSMTTDTRDSCNAQRSVPVLQIHGTADQVIPYNGNGSWSVPIDTIIKYWVNHNSCNTTPTSTPVPDVDNTDGSTVTHMIYTNSNDGTTVEHYKVDGGAHEWPGDSGNMDINASLEMWKFFSKYDLDGRIGFTSVGEVENQATNIRITHSTTQKIIHLNIDSRVSGNIKVIITGIDGKVLRNADIPYIQGAHVYSLPTNELAPGLYVVKAMTRSGATATEKVVIQ